MSLGNCQQLTKKPLSLGGKNLQQSEAFNVSSDRFLDGIYPVSETTTSLSYMDPGSDKVYAVAYRPVTVPMDYKFIEIEMAQGRPVIDIVLYPEGAKRLYQATLEASRAREPLFLVIDGKVISAPMAQQAIEGGRVQFFGSNDIQEVQEIVKRMKAIP
ncbi:SecDF P1 head subdomain-containing protein [Nonlabens xiamenensis]|uniref:SecDF P1 head subdomain-containing protein n=1 Tax=Nonlabens xiamenensis TaxID=2341043 RepID=UPI0013DE6E9C|nr:hypothetical protein [Nonlabens xiamenensis]